uniref:Uncharacterized protein n=1 Tax=Anguilla anguilla TaxID=7936 RepID=A0A0E9XU79_ANGAN
MWSQVLASEGCYMSNN